MHAAFKSGIYESVKMSITFERLGVETLAAGLMFKLIVFTQECVTERTLEYTTTYTVHIYQT